MKTIILMVAMLLTLAFTHPLVADDLTLFDGYLSGTETAQLIDGKLIVDGSGSGTSTLGTFTYTYHFNVDPAIGKGIGTSKFTFANGDTWTNSVTGGGEFTGLAAISRVTELGFVKKATGQFAGVPGNFVIERYGDQAAGTTSGAFHGQFLKVTP